ncbi:hydroxypyruvate reductase [Amylibacter marinus]|uniref:Hydroxypyruvate reductase n=1 Tax=Amylibacter marinus TaxID=1475483 RepID=A0ABQ5VY37_9RHOB|nr:glycerate kinase [Amylibacter marinus]GLQ36119.1 hydroxypyruvate reductase [Amylibacter marinus]
MIHPKQFLTALFDCAVATADPMRVISKFLPDRPKGRLIVIGAGKASARMAEAVETAIGPCEGIVVTRYGYARRCQGIEIHQASHPIPDAAGQEATRKIMDLVSGLTEEDHVLVLISGGGSALLCAPIHGVSLADKIQVNAALLASGAPISEMNVIRKRLSRVKGGKLAAACFPAKVTCLMISDVPGDDIAMIASGPTVGDSSTTTEVLQILADRQIAISRAVREAIQNSGETLPPDAPIFDNVENIIVAAPLQSLDAAAKMAQNSGLNAKILGDAIEGEARDLARSHVHQAIEMQQNLSVGDRPILMLSGGECTVTRRGNGIGGPNAEYALAAAIALEGRAGIHLVAADTDGVDGAAEVAGAYVGPDSLRRAREHGISPARALHENDAHTFFSTLKDQIIPGPTLTNVNDFRAILVYPNSG